MNRMKIKKYTFFAIITPDIEMPNVFNIEFEDLPGCLSCAYSYSEAKRNAHEALSLYLDGMKESEIPTLSGKLEKKHYEDGVSIVKISVWMKVFDGVLFGYGVKRYWMSMDPRIEISVLVVLGGAQKHMKINGYHINIYD